MGVLWMQPISGGRRMKSGRGAALGAAPSQQAGGVTSAQKSAPQRARAGGGRARGPSSVAGALREPLRQEAPASLHNKKAGRWLMPATPLGPRGAKSQARPSGQWLAQPSPSPRGGAARWVRERHARSREEAVEATGLRRWMDSDVKGSLRGSWRRYQL